MPSGSGRNATQHFTDPRRRPVSVVEVLVLAQDGHQVPLIPDQGPVEQLSAAAADPAFHDRVHPRRLDRRADHLDASGLEHCVERGGEAGVPVVQHELHPRPGVFQVYQKIAGLLHYPRLDRVPGSAEDPDAAGAMLDHCQDIHLRAVEEIGGEEVKRQDPLCLRSQELWPTRPIPARRRVDPGALMVNSSLYTWSETMWFSGSNSCSRMMIAMVPARMKKPNEVIR